MTVSEVKGFGRQKGHTELYRGAEYVVNWQDGRGHRTAKRRFGVIRRLEDLPPRPLDLPRQIVNQVVAVQNRMVVIVSDIRIEPYWSTLSWCEL